MRRTLLLATLLLAACGRGGGGAPDIVISDAWVREARTGSTAAYLTIANEGDGADRLLAVSVPPPAEASLHSTTNDDGISRMRPIADGVEIAAGERVVLKPGGTHVMVTGLTAPLESGAALPLTLRFEHWGDRQVMAEVRAAAGAPMRMSH